MTSDYWAKLAECEFIFEQGCWEGCKSFCCRWEFQDFKFLMIPSGGTLFYMPQEYDYFAAHGKVPQSKLYSMSVDYGNNHPMKLYYHHCQVSGECKGVFDRTLYCKLYPFLPVFDIDGNLQDVVLISVYDITMDLIGDSSPCTVIPLKKQYFNAWKNSSENFLLLKEPYVLFHLRAAFHLYQNYTNTLLSRKDLMSLKGADFWKRWELEYLSGRLINKAALSEQINKDYVVMLKKYGNFM